MRQTAGRSRESMWLDIRPGHYYELILSSPDAVPVATRWEGGKLLRQGGVVLPAPIEDAGPLALMYRKRIIFKLDDLAGEFLPSWQRFCAVVQENGGKADLGINAGACDDEVFDWVKSLDLGRFEVWNHTWDHSRSGTNQYGHPYDVQYENMDRHQRLVKEKLGITMRAYGCAGIKLMPDSDWIADHDEVTYYVVRNHPDMWVYYHAEEVIADRGRGNINSDGILTPGSFTAIEHPPGVTKPRDPAARYPVEWVAKLYPDENPNRPPAVGNSEEIVWRMQHPSWPAEEVAKMASNVLGFHPWNWKEDDLESLAALVSYISNSDDWRFSNISEVYHWMRDRDLLALEKIAPDRYRLEAQKAHAPHTLELGLPRNTRAEEHAYRANQFDRHS